MGSSPLSSVLVSPEFQAEFRARADAAGRMTFAKFMELALYHPAIGYYRRPRPRVGYVPGTDFFTASSSGSVFGELVATSCAALLRTAGRDPGSHVFVEVGVEPDSAGVLGGLTHPFLATKTVRVGEAVTLQGECIVFSNELFDAQPCVRSVFHQGRWVEIGVELRGDRLLEVELETPPPFRPAPATEGYHFDQPLAAAALADRIAAQPWRGLFVAFDYGKTLRELTEATPGGTARAYFRHTQSNDLLARPGEQDLTCHVCWDWISDALRRHGFGETHLNFQEAFFIRNAGSFIAAASAAEAERLSARKLALQQLLHPAHLGQKFQVLYALR
jgi:SAM-dependent MidA family methyltransferase